MHLVSSSTQQFTFADTILQILGADVLTTYTKNDPSHHKPYNSTDVCVVVVCVATVVIDVDVVYRTS